MLARRLMPRPDEFRVAVAAAAAAAASGEESLAGLREIEELLAGIGIEDDGADRNLQAPFRRPTRRGNPSLRHGRRDRL